GLIDEIVGGAASGVEVEARAAAAARDVVVDDDREAGAVVAALEGAVLVGDRDVLEALDDAPGAEVTAGEALDEVALGDHARLRRARAMASTADRRAVREPTSSTSA